MITLRITKLAKQERNIILTIAKNNGFPLQIIHKLKKEKKMLKTQKTNVTSTQTRQNKYWVTFTYYTPLIHKVASLFKNTNLKIAFRTKNIYNKIRDRIPPN